MKLFLLTKFSNPFIPRICSPSSPPPPPCCAKYHNVLKVSQCLFAGFSFFWKKNFSKWLGKSLFPEKRKIKSCGKKISLVFANWLILGIGHKLPNLHKLTYWFDVLTNGKAGFYIAPPPFSKNWGFFQNLEKL